MHLRRLDSSGAPCTRSVLAITRAAVFFIYLQTSPIVRALFPEPFIPCAPAACGFFWRPSHQICAVQLTCAVIYKHLQTSSVVWALFQGPGFRVHLRRVDSSGAPRTGSALSPAGSVDHGGVLHKANKVNPVPTASTLQTQAAKRVCVFVCV